MEHGILQAILIEGRFLFKDGSNVSMNVVCGTGQAEEEGVMERNACNREAGDPESVRGSL